MHVALLWLGYWGYNLCFMKGKSQQMAVNCLELYYYQYQVRCGLYN